MKKGEIFLVNFDPAFGSEFKKIRLVVILQSEKITSNLITAIPLSSQISKKNTNEILIKKDSKNRLFRDSILKVRQISSFDKKRFFHFVGEISTKKINEIENYLKIHFDLK